MGFFGDGFLYWWLISERSIVLPKFLFIFFMLFFVYFNENVFIEIKQEEEVRCAGIMCNDEDFFFYNYNFYYFLPIIGGDNEN